MSGTPDTEDRDGPTVAAPGYPTLEPDERLWIVRISLKWITDSGEVDHGFR